LALQDSQWDLCIVDEAHKMAAYRYGEKVSKTLRYKVGELLSPKTEHFLFLTATPHRGDPENFRLLLDLLEPGFFANSKMLQDSIKNRDNPLYIRRLKEDLRDFNNIPIFPPRVVKTIKYALSEEEKELYNQVTDYVEKQYNKALQTGKRNVAFALTILQRRLASSTRAVRRSLERRYNRLKELYEKGQKLQQNLDYEEEYLEDLEERERWELEEELLEKLSSAETLEELDAEIKTLEQLIITARQVEKKEIETKLQELKKVVEEEKIKETQTKILIFTEAKDTLEYLVEKLKKWGYSVGYIHGGMNLDQRIHQENEFNNGPTQIMVSTEAGGEGINLQKSCWIMVNYDIPWNPNRLEQRMGRIHRYGQRHEVHIYNLVSKDTIEGSILNKLFEKLDQIRKDMNSDRVFDVIQDIYVGKSLKDLIMEAISKQRTLEDILENFDKLPNQEAIKRVKQATQEALATRHIDLTPILGEQRKAKENRLVPEYVEEFFKRCAKKLNFKMEKRQDGFWRITSIPYEIRNQPHEFKIKYGEVAREYLKVSFDKEKASKGQATFVAMGHPLLEAVIEEILRRFSDEVNQGATFIDPEGIRDGIIWFLQAEVRDGKNSIAGRRFFAVYQDRDNNFSFVNPAILWDLKPLTKDIPQNFLPIDKDGVVEYVIANGLDSYKKELLELRLKNAEIKRKYGLKSLEQLIGESERKLVDYEIRKIKGENLDLAIQNERQRKQDLIRKKQMLEKEIKAETHLTTTEPKIIGAIRVIPAQEKPLKEEDMISDQEIERIGMQIAIEYEQSQGRIPEDVSFLNLGYDIRSQEGENHFRYIEVKARAKTGTIALTPNEWLMAQRLKDEYWLYIIENASTNPELYLIQNPASCLSLMEEVSIIRYIVKDWKEKALKT